MPRTTIPTEKNVRHLKTHATDDELTLYHEAQRAIRDALTKATDKYVGTLITDVQVNLRTNPSDYHQSVVQCTLRQEEGDPYPIYLSASIQLTRSSRPNPDFNEDEPEQWDY
jgi:hypothetical protein